MTTSTRKPLDYFIGLEYSFKVVADPDGGYVVLFPDLPGCMTQVESLEELPAMANDVRIGWIETEYERGMEIPLPSYPEEYSGKFNVRLPKSLHRSLAEGAEAEGISLNQYVVMLLSRGDAQARVETRLNRIEAHVRPRDERQHYHVVSASTPGKVKNQALPRVSPKLTMVV